MAAVLEAIAELVIDCAYFVSRAGRMVFRFGRSNATASEGATLRSTGDLIGGLIGMGLIILVLGIAIAWLIER